MKTSKVLKSLIAVACLAAGSAFAVPTYTVDTLLGSQNLGNAGDATELAALESFVPDFSGTLTKVNQSGNNVLATLVQGTTDEWYIDLGSASPGYFVLKFATGGTTVANDTYFFQNIGEMNLLVFTNAEVNFLSGGDCGGNGQNTCNIGRLSHYDYGGTGGSGGSTGGEVPEPGSLALMGLGLLGAVSLRKRKQG